MVTHNYNNRRARARLVRKVTRQPTTPTKCSSSVISSVERLSYSTTTLSRKATIEELSNNTLLKIFSYALDSSPQHWIRLVHVCHKWRRIVFEAQQALSLRLFCTYGTPVLKTLDCWPGLPIVVRYGGSRAFGTRPTPQDEDNITAALKQSDRVSSIALTVTDSLLKKLSTIERPFSELEDLVLIPRDTVTLTLPSTFLWGSRLRFLHLTRIASPALLPLLRSSRNLVDLQLHDVLKPSHFSSDALTNALSELTQLRSLSLHFPESTTSKYRPPPSPSPERAVLPVLTRLNFRGITDYLEGLVAIIDAPRLEDIEITLFGDSIIDDPRLDDIEITLFDGSIFGLPKLSKFIDQIEIHKSHRQAYISSSEDAIFISLIQPGVSTRLKLQLFCESLNVQICSMARICAEFSAVLFNVGDLRISTTQPSGSLDGLHPEIWSGLLNSFTVVTSLHLDANDSTALVRAMHLKEKQRVLPALHKLYIIQPEPRQAPLTGAILSLMTSRRLCDRPIAVEYERICDVGTGTMHTLCHHRHSLTRQPSTLFSAAHH
jgi:hypothetical protein